MEWCEKLYLGDNARKKSAKIIKKIKKRKLQLDVFIISLPICSKDVLEIYPAYILLQKNELFSSIKIIGIASGREEALSLAEKIIMDTYNERNDFQIENFLWDFKDKERQ